MLIKVTHQHIAMGCMRKSHRCPVAHAVNEHLGSGYSSTIGLCNITIANGRGTTMWQKEQPVSVFKFVKLFDGGEHVKPFEFELSIPEKYLP